MKTEKKIVYEKPLEEYETSVKFLGDRELQSFKKKKETIAVEVEIKILQ